MKKLLLLSYLFLYLTLGCEKKEVPTTNVASLTNEHFVEIIKINFNEELGGLRRMDKSSCIILCLRKIKFNFTGRC